MTETKIRPQSILLKVATTELTPSYVGMLHLDSNNILRVDTVGAGVPADFVTVLPEHTINGNHGPKVTITQTAADNALVIAKNGAGVAVDLSVASGGTGAALNISNSGTGYGLSVAQVGNQVGIQLNSSSTSYAAQVINSKYCAAVTMNTDQGYGLSLTQSVNTIEPNSGFGLLYVNKVGTGASPAMIVNNSGTGVGVLVNQTGNGKGLSIAQAGNGNAVAITKTSTDTSATVLVTVSSGTGAGIQINQTGNGKGLSIAQAGNENAVAITKTSTDASSAVIVAVQSGSGPGLYVNNSGTGVAAQITQNGANRALDIYQNAVGNALVISKANIGAGTCITVANSGTGAGLVITQVGAAVALGITRGAGGVGTEHCIQITNNGVGQDIVGNASNWYISKLGNATFAYVNATTLSHGGHFVKIVDRTISGDAITIDSSVGMVRLIPESGNHDHLGYIHGGSDGQILIVAVKNAGQSVEPVEPGGADSINDGGGRNLDNRSDRVAYMFDAPIGQWCELHFTNNA